MARDRIDLVTVAFGEELRARYRTAWELPQKALIDLNIKRQVVRQEDALAAVMAGEEERPRLKSFLTRWGLSMVIVGPRSGSPSAMTRQ